MKRFWGAAAVCLVSLLLAGCNDPAFLAALTVSEVDLSKVGDGVYHGSYSLSIPAGSLVGMPTAVLDVTVARNRFTGIQITTPEESTVSNADMKIGALVEKILAEQKLNVDVVGGASYTKKAVQKAVENAFSAYLLR
jgi:uncharacterized protein with FMN-binding domain